MKRLILICIIAINAISCSSCKKESQQLTPISVRDTSIAIVSPNGGESYHAGDYITVKWKGSNLPIGTVITAELQNINPAIGVVGTTLKPQHAAHSPQIASTDNDGEELFQLPLDSQQDVYHEKHFGVLYTYGKSFKISLMAVFPTPIGTPILVNNLFRTSSSKDFFTISAPTN